MVDSQLLPERVGRRGINQAVGEAEATLTSIPWVQCFYCVVSITARCFLFFAVEIERGARGEGEKGKGKPRYYLLDRRL